MKALLAAAFVALALPAAASAHVNLLRTEPPDRAVLQHAPAAVRVVFDDAVRAGPGIAAVRNGGGSVLSGGAHVVAGRTLVVPLLRHLADGDYTVRWSVVSDDGHLESGVLAFAVGLGRAAPVAVLGAEPTGARPPDVAARWLFLAGVLAAVGIAFVALFTGLATEAVAVLLSTAAVAAALGAADEAHRAGVSTRAGTALVVGSAYAVVVALVGAAATLERRALRPALVLAIGLVAVPAVSGHALDRGLSRVNVAADVLHVAGAAAWAGALLGIVLGAPARRAGMLALGGVALLGVTGVVRASYELLHVSQLWGTAYGRAILVKTGILLAALALGFVLRAHVRRRAAVELALVGVLLVAVAVLVLERPGRNVAPAPAAALPSEPSPPPPAPPRDAIVVARELGPWGVALASEPKRLTVLLLSPAGGGASGRDVTIDGRAAAPCGQGCYRTDGAHGDVATVAVDGIARSIPSPQQSQATRTTLRSFTAFYESRRSVEFAERLASDATHVVRSRWRVEAPNRFAYTIPGGAAAIVIGAHRWDRASPASRWIESSQTPLPQPVVPWTRATNVWQISVHDVVFVDPTVPAYFDLRFGERPEALHMVAAAHFMTDRYVSFDSGRALRPPR